MIENVKKYALLLGPQCIVTNTKDGWGTCRIGVVAITDDDKIRNGVDTQWYDFQFGCQWNLRKEGDAPRSSRTYAWEGAYRTVYHVGLKEAERMVKHLRKVQKASDAFHDDVSRTDGRVVTFGDWLRFVAFKLGINEARVQVKSGGGWNYDSSVYETLILNDAIHWIDSEISCVLGPVEVSPTPERGTDESSWGRSRQGE